MTLPPSLQGPELAPLWKAVRERLERRGSSSRGRLTRPALSTIGRHRLSSLLGRPLTATIDLAVLEQALVAVGAVGGLVEVLDAVGHPMSSDGERRRAELRGRKDAKAAVRGLVSTWAEPWARGWVDELIQTGLLRGLDVDGATSVVTDVRSCLDALSSAERPLSRVELAARLLGNSHALDSGTRSGSALARALRQQFATEMHDDTDRTVWDRAGAPSDSVSAPALTWNLPVRTASQLAPIIDTATALGVVAHLSQMALRSYPLDVRPGTVVLVTENPRVVEAAAQRRAALCVVSTNGNPSTAVRVLLAQLLASDAEVRYHGDFDAAGLSICRRMAALGLRPWRMDSLHYEQAVVEAVEHGVDLPIDESDPGRTPWDEPLRDAFRACGRVVHEERVLNDLLLD